MDLEHIRSQIEHTRVQVSRQLKEILQLQRARLSATAAETLLLKKLDKIEGLCAQRDLLKRELPMRRKFLSGRKRKINQEPVRALTFESLAPT